MALPDVARPLAVGPDADSTPPTAVPAIGGAVVCRHCGLPAGIGGPGETAFCCAGCEVAWELIHRTGLTGYYTLAERRSARVDPLGRDFEEFGHPAFEALYVTARDGLRTAELYLEGVHCASCVWLVERVPLAVPGTASATLDIGRSRATITWHPGQTSLPAIARFLDRIGYRPHPWRSSRIDAARRTEDRQALIRLGVAGALATNVMTLALALYAGWFGGMDAGTTRFFRWLSLLLTVPIVVWPGRVFFQGAVGALRLRRLHMDVPIALAILVAMLRGTVNTVVDAGPIYFDGVATLIFLLLLGRWVQQQAQRRAADASTLLHAMTPAVARVVEADGIREIPLEALTPGMRVQVRPGETLPADGRVVEGRSALDCALLTGESTPVSVAEGSLVYAGTTNRTAVLVVESGATGEESRLGRLLRAVEQSARQRAPAVLTADRMAGWFVAVVLTLAMATWLLWRGTDPAAAVDHAIALLIVTCPCALALATPLTLASSVGQAARRGLLVRSGEALELLARPATVVFDKTGTLTEGQTRLVRWSGPDDLRGAILALERDSTHPVADGFRAAWPDVSVPAAAQEQHVAGGGVEGVIADRHVVVGSPGFVRDRAGGVDRLLADRQAGATPVLVAVDGLAVGLAEFGDTLRPEAGPALTQLRRRGWVLRLLSGDASDVVRSVGARLGLVAGRVEGEATPERKQAVIAALAEAGPVVMVGDGVNDAAAIARATVGVAVRGGAEASLAAADVYLSRPGLDGLIDLVEGAERTLRVIRRNIAISLAYNLVGIGLAMSGTITPLLAAVLMPVSSVSVILIAWRSRTFPA